MGRKAKTLKLMETARLELKEEYKHSTSPQFSRRCLILLLKNKELTSNDIGELLGITD